MRLDLAQCSHTGRIREHNEDHIGIDAELGLLVVADGMGGYQAGEVASEIAVQTIMSQVREHIGELSEQQRHGVRATTWLLEQAVLKANQAIFQTAENDVQYQGMGTTVVAALITNEHLSIAHVGDSRLYRLRGHQLQTMTSDHSVLQELIDCGFYTPEQARHSPNKNLVTRALGVGDIVNVEVQEQKIHEHDLYLLCSDGLNDMLEDSEIRKLLLTTQQSLQQTAERLVNLANDKGGEDNISVVLAHFQPNHTASVGQRWLQQLRRWWSGR